MTGESASAGSRPWFTRTDRAEAIARPATLQPEAPEPRAATLLRRFFALTR